ncbi:MAG: bifunctional DNA-binding transcriptional regulator/O6-methylguanine-DNA methyltransferase Ada [Alphaproteobacteria bacterium]|nr:bifunctional DNA-binding transcriptional regulator/O6-methylguanine-DNA methyltransferase Ada [Alphaproteobacteria bacterium]
MTEMIQMAGTAQRESDAKISDEVRWQAVLGREAALDGAFVYAVRSTGIYCRPSCPSKRPNRVQVAFYEVPQAAEAAGFRACKRCKPRQAASSDTALAAVRAACDLIDADNERAPTLDDLAAHVGLSASHLQRRFKRVMGVSPREYADARRMARFREAVKAGDDVTGALYEAGYGSSSRLYERAGAHLGMTPATYAKGGKGAEIRYALADCAYGRILVAGTKAGICFLAFGEDDAKLAKELALEFPAAALERDDVGLGRWLDGVLDYLNDGTPHPELPLDVRATAFQRRVWQALTQIPYGETRTYSEIAAMLGASKAQRAVGRACATNPVSLLIPCHRAIREDGGLGGYRWGLKTKQGLLEHERKAASGRK